MLRHLTRLRRLLPLGAVAIFAAAMWLLERELADHHLAEAIAYLEALPAAALLTAAAAAVVSYIALIGYDLLALRYAGGTAPLGVVAKTSFIANALAHNLGFSALTGGSIRYRSYSAAGLSGFQITTAIAFHTAMFPLGASLLGGLAFVLQPEGLAHLVTVPEQVVRVLGLLLIAPSVALIVVSALGLRHISVARWRIDVPTPGVAAGQSVASGLDLLFAAATLFVLLPEGHTLGFLPFVAIYVTALLAAVISAVPAGIGVFEGLIVTLTAGQIDAHQVLGALLAYRAIYYVAPLLLAIVWFGFSELAAKRKDLSAATQLAARQWESIAPTVIAAAVFAAGAMLLISGAAPEEIDALETLNDWLPLAFIEGSHLIASLIGVGLLLLSGSLLQRVDSAYFATVVLLSAGTAAALVRGTDYHEALALAVTTLALLPARRAFYRHGRLTALQLSPQWLLAVGAILAGSIWLGFFAHRHVEYSADLWWQFELDGNAPRFLRASLLAMLLFAALGARQLLMPHRKIETFPSEADLARAAAIVAASKDSSANIALLGDKSLLFNDTGDGFLMYRVQGRSWIALGDPIAPAHRQAELLWRFRELSDEYGGRCVFYQVKPEHLSLYADLGLALYKMGDEARVDLRGFALEAAQRRDIRQAHRRAAREGATFEMFSREAVAAQIGALRKVSDSWLASKAGREKGFSLGYFDAAYLKHFACGVVRVGGEIVAFANIWESAGRTELSIDLMRHGDTPVHSIMDFLFVEIMLWGKAQGYQWFNLGMAPLSGLEARRLGPLWPKLGGLIYRAGEQFYSFRGLRRYKDKFAPEWRPKYLACPGGLAIGRVLVDLTSLISGRVNPQQR